MEGQKSVPMPETITMTGEQATLILQMLSSGPYNVVNPIIQTFTSIIVGQNGRQKVDNEETKE